MLLGGVDKLSVFNLGEETKVNTIAIRVKDRDKMIAFYRDIVGFDLKREENELAIFGTGDSRDEILWLEESPRARDFDGEIKKLQRLSIIVADKKEFAAVAIRVQQAQYPVMDALAAGENLGLLLKDPEGNELEVYHGSIHTAAFADAVPLDFAGLAEAATENTKLSQSAHFDKVHLNVPDIKKQQKFLEEVLGLHVKAEQAGIHVLNEGKFHVGLRQATGGTILEPTDTVLGLDFIQLQVAAADIEKLIAHLDSLKIEYFVDKKHKILTVFDTIGIEWWFMKKED